jgi:choline dehydrogenase-like flavoprotein
MTNKKHAIVVGSGPSGLAASNALLKRGYSVKILDYGNIPDSEEGGIGIYQTNTNRENLIKVRSVNLRGKDNYSDLIDQNIDFESNYFYKDSKKLLVGNIDKVIINPSLGLGGLSNLWGSSVLPPLQNDISDWPLSVSSLEPFYEEIEKYMRISSSNDSISNLIQFYVGKPHSFPLGIQGKEFLKDLESNQEKLIENNFFIGRAKQAIDPDCELTDRRYPFGPIFNSATVINELRKRPDCEYIPNILVDRLVELDGYVRVEARDSDAKKLYHFKAQKAFLACGPISSTRIVANSLKFKKRDFILKTNQNMFMPFFRYSRTRNMSMQVNNSIPQVFFTITDSKVCKRAVHIQVTQYGDYVLEKIQNLLPYLTPFINTLGRPLLERMMVFQTLLHSDYSDSIKLNLSKDEDQSKVDLCGIKNPVMKNTYHQVVKSIRRQHHLLRGFTTPALMMIDPTGASNHLGCTLPMRVQPAEGETDLLGRPSEWRHTHIIDSTVLPSLPATTITFTIMANATRIVDEVVKQSEHS